MNIQIHTKGIDLTPAIDSYIQKRSFHLEKLLKEENDNVLFRIEIGRDINSQKQGEVFIAGLNLDIVGKVHRTESKSEELYTAIDDSIAEMVRVIEKSKGKKETLFRKGAMKIKRLIKGLYSRDS